MTDNYYIDKIETYKKYENNHIILFGPFYLLFDREILMTNGHIFLSVRNVNYI
jgi:hypothetical protein